MTSIAVTASVCASASEAALLVASFMSHSLDLGMTHRRANTFSVISDKLIQASFLRRRTASIQGIHRFLRNIDANNIKTTARQAPRHTSTQLT